MADRRKGEAPDDATEDRAAQQHDLAYEDTGGQPEQGFYPSEDIEDRAGENTPDAAHPEVNWNDRVQPERVPDAAAPPDDVEKGT